MDSALLDQNSALIVIDLQKGASAATLLPTSIGDVVERSARLAAAFRAKNMPVVLVSVGGKPPGRSQRKSAAAHDRPSDWTDTLPGLNQQPSDHLVLKHALSAFCDTDLGDYLKTAGVTQLVFTGWATSLGVESSVRQAFDTGFNVLVVEDAVSDVDEGAHLNSLIKIFPRISEIANTDVVLAILETR